MLSSLFINFTTNAQQLHEEIDSHHLLLTIDLWTSNATEAYFTVTLHFIDDQLNLISRVLQTCKMPEQHTGVNIASRLQDVASEWNTPDEHIVAVVCDNAPNIRVDIEEVGWEYVCCFAHTMQLVISTLG